MPELPEVETVKSVLEKVVNGRTIQKIDILRSSSVPGDKEQFISSLTGEKFLRMSRIGKFLIFHLTNDKVIISHLRMEGKYYELEENEPNTKYARVVLHLDNGHKVCYDDSRCFGYMRLSNESIYLKDKEIAKLGPEPWDADIATIMKQVKRSSLPIKSALLSQTLMTGLGNIYVDETLFAANIHPLTPANKITKKQWELIKQEASRILKEAIISGGSTIKSYHPGKDIDGNFQSKLLAYGKAGTKCPNCGSTFRFIKVGGRGTTFCPKCQEYHGKAIKVAIFGKIASGKSTVLNIFKEQGIPTLSADEVVKDLYNKKEVINKINNAFGLEGNTIDRNALRNLLASDSKNIKKIDKIVHPLVKEETKKFLKEHNGLVVVEVPLLYESKMDSLFDVIIAVDIKDKKQAELISQRDGNKAKDLKTINKASTFDNNKNKADFIIDNDADLNSLNKKVINIINKLKCRLD
jgi:formamidopyrimidine-DNA glycosylase